jgi:MFS family permease
MPDKVICSNCGAQYPFNEPFCPCGMMNSQREESLFNPKENANTPDLGKPKTSSPIFGIVSIGLGIGAVLMPYFAAVFFAPAAIICGVVASRKGQKARGFIGIVLGLIGVAWITYTSNQISQIASSIGGKSIGASETAASTAITVSGLDWKRGKYNSLSVIGRAVNTSSKTIGYALVEINLHDKSGAVIGSTMANINNLGPGQTWKFEAPVISEENVESFQLKGVTGF